MLVGSFLGFRAQPMGYRIVRAAALGLTAIVAFWILWVLLAAVTAPSWPLLQSYERAGFLRGTVVAGIPALLMFGLVAALFRKGE
ncbi:MAG: hypothetical protein WEG36_09165 [Gemmatimonadota bacterium]